MENVSSKVSIPDRVVTGGMVKEYEDNGPIPLGKLSPIPNLNSEVNKVFYGRALCNQWNLPLARFLMSLCMM
jgi:hypothetical protein